MRDRRKRSMFINARGEFQKLERRVRVLDRRKHNNFHRIIHIDVRNLWGFLVSKK
jgi:hypothetical protein